MIALFPGPGVRRDAGERQRRHPVRLRVGRRGVDTRQRPIVRVIDEVHHGRVNLTSVEQVIKAIIIPT